MPDTLILVLSMTLIGIVLFCLVFKVDSSRTKQAPWLKGHYTHRGFYTKDQRLSENSLGAFKQSIESGVGIELDVQLSQDGKVYVFHDDDLYRMTGINGLLEEKKSEELELLRLINSDEKIPLLSDVLTLVKGQVPLLVELKSTIRKEESVKAVVQLMKEYEGHFAYCSFDPLMLGLLKKYDPDRLRGLNMEYSLNKKQFGWPTRVVLQWALLTPLNRPDYLSVDYTHIPFVYRMWRVFGAFGMMWALPSQALEDKVSSLCETVIFEHYHPS